MNQALFLDRDGIVNLDHGYVHKQKDFQFVDGIFELVRKSTEAGRKNIIVTNQAGIGRGYYSVQDFQDLMSWVKSEFSRNGGILHGVYFCPHHPEFGLNEFKLACTCRKPMPGMLLQAIREFDIDPKASSLIGDNISDADAGLNAGIGQNIIVSSRLRHPDRRVEIASNLKEAERMIIFG